MNDRGRLDFKPTGTINYYPHTFNTVTKERAILDRGGVPLHKIVNYLYDHYYNYIAVAGKKNITFISLILKQQAHNRPETPHISKLPGRATKKIRKTLAKADIENIILIITKVFKYFIAPNGKELSPYRKDTNFSELKKSYDYFNDIVIPKLTALV